MNFDEKMRERLRIMFHEFLYELQVDDSIRLENPRKIQEFIPTFIEKHFPFPFEEVEWD